MPITKTAGRWDKDNWPIYFPASNTTMFKYTHDYIPRALCAVNEIKTPYDMAVVESFIKSGKDVLIDSGVYVLATEHADKHKISMNEALGLAPDKVDGFDELYARYCALVEAVGDRVWGYIEIDQGGRENKIKTRAKLEALGMRPIPVYHPMNDGWDYFDYLAKRYDRICLGNIVQADPDTRKRLIATAWERRRNYPHLWIHALGMTANEVTTAFPLNSCDSSTWVGPIRWGRQETESANRPLNSPLDIDFLYAMDVPSIGHERGYDKGTHMCAYHATIMSKTCKAIADDQRKELGADPGMFK